MTKQSWGICLSISKWGALELGKEKCIEWSIFQDSLDHCPMPINTDRCQSKFWHGSQCRSIPINASQSGIKMGFVWKVWKTCLIWHWSALIGIERNWSALRGISDQYHNFDRYWSGLGIDRGSPDFDRETSKWSRCDKCVQFWFSHRIVFLHDIYIIKSKHLFT